MIQTFIIKEGLYSSQIGPIMFDSSPQKSIYLTELFKFASHIDIAVNDYPTTYISFLRLDLKWALFKMSVVDTRIHVYHSYRILLKCKTRLLSIKQLVFLLNEILVWSGPSLG